MTLPQRSPLSLSLLLLLSSPFAYAQQAPFCGTRQQLAPEVVRQALAADAQRGGDEGPVRTLKLKVILAAAPANGEPFLAFQASEVQAQIDATNAIFARSNTGIQFQLCGPMQVVVDYGLFATGFQANEVVQQYYEPGYINAFFVFELPQNLGGVAIGPMVFVSRFGPRNTLAHELGHSLGLMHPHDWITEPELVDGSNCSTGGDMLCDTPADPNLGTPGLVVQPCAYVGTVTDANGDLYTPLLNNVMSYSPCLVDSFTPDQGAVMRYHSDSIWLHLRRTATPTTITPFNTRLCDNAGPITLTATPAPGTFSGALVTGSTLNNTPNPTGEYNVLYTPATAPEGPGPLVDQYCLPFGWGPGAHMGQTTDSVWQSFAPQLDGTFLRMDLYARGISTQSLRMRIYAGTGVQGAALVDVSTTMDADTAWTIFDLPSGLASTSGSTYTALFTAAQPFVVMQPMGASYADGESSINGQDVEFRHWVTATPPCQEARRYYALRQVPQRSVLSVPQALCHSDQRPVRFRVDSVLLQGSSTYLDGEPTTSFIPAQLATGPHQVDHIYTLQGCTDTVSQQFVVQPPPAFTFPNSAPPICTIDPPVVLDAEPAGGYFRINGVRDSLLVPATLGPGTHTIDYFYTAQLDTLRFIDQLCCFESPVLTATVVPDELVWQSFVAGQSGTLVNVQMGLDLLNTPRTFEVFLHAGEGTAGPVLWQDTRTTAEGYNGLFNGMVLPVTFGNTYTAAFRLLPDNAPPPAPFTYYYTGNGYTAGRAQLSTGVGNGTANDDLAFSVFIEQQFPCADSTSYTIDVEVCTGLAEATWTGASVAPNPFTSTVLLRVGGQALRHTLLTVDGRVLASGQAAAHSQVQLPVETLSPGCYLLQLQGNDGPQATGRTEVLRLVKE